jgi:hypothetical protein
MVEKPEAKKEFGYGRVAFLAHSAGISAELRRGRMKKAVWREYRDRLGGLGYLQFLRYVGRYIPHHRPTAVVAAAPISLSSRTQTASTAPHEPRGAGKKAEELPTFHFDPMDAYREKFD